MTRKELAEKLNISIGTLNNWEKYKQELVRIINLGIKAENNTKKIKEILEEIEKEEKKTNSGKFELK